MNDNSTTNDDDMIDPPNAPGWIALSVGALLFLAGSIAFLAIGMPHIGGDEGSQQATASAPAPAGNSNATTGQAGSAPASPPAAGQEQPKR
jgi:hypothetical protein